MKPKKLYYEWRKAFIKDDRLPSICKHLLHALHVYMDVNTLEAYPSRESLSKDTGLSKKTISKYTGIAVKLGWLKIFKSKQDGNQFLNNIYKAKFPLHSPSYSPHRESQDTTREPDDPGVGNQGNTNYPYNYLYNSTNNKNNDSIEPELDAKEKRFSVIDVGEEVTIRESQVKTKSQLIHTILGLRNQYAREKVIDWVFKNDLSEVRSREELKITKINNLDSHFTHNSI